MICLAFCGCSIRRIAGNALTDLTRALYQQRDVALARDGSASFLLIADSLIIRNPADPAILLNGVRAYSAYASAFLLGTEQDRAFVLLDQALQYGFSLWEIQFGWKSVNLWPIDDWERALQNTTVNDVPALFWTANTWVSWITAHPDSILALSDLPHVLAAMQRVLELDETYQQGAVHLFFGMYYAVQPAGVGRDLDKSHAHFQKAIQLAGPDAMLPRVLFARYYARACFDEDLFRQVLEDVLISPSQSPDPDLNLMNAIARERAAMYLAQIDELF
jgi:hypothetical protein